MEINKVQLRSLSEGGFFQVVTSDGHKKIFFLENKFSKKGRTHRYDGRTIHTQCDCLELHSGLTIRFSPMVMITKYEPTEAEKLMIIPFLEGDY